MSLKNSPSLPARVSNIHTPPGAAKTERHPKGGTMETDEDLAKEVRDAWVYLAKAIFKADGEGLRVECGCPEKVFNDPRNISGQEKKIIKEF